MSRLGLPINEEVLDRFLSGIEARVHMYELWLCYSKTQLFCMVTGNIEEAIAAEGIKQDLLNQMLAATEL